VRLGETLKVYLTGRVALEAEGLELEDGRFPGRQGRLLFAYLINEQGRPVPRDELAEVLWGDNLPATWDKALTVLVSKLRSLLTEVGVDGGQALTNAFGCYRLELPHDSWVDVVAAEDAAREAERALAAGEVEEAIAAASLVEAITRHPFLPGDGCTWVDTKRRELDELRWRAVYALGDAHLQAQLPTKVASWAEQAIELQPFREAGHRLLMQAHAACGNRAEALQAYERCRRLLDDELGTYPSPETESIYRWLLEAPAAKTADAAGTADTGSPAPPPEPKPRRARRRTVVIAAGVVVAAGATVAVVQADEGHHTKSAALHTLALARCSALHYQGVGSPQLLIAADLPLQSGALETTTPMVDAITLALERRHYLAGRYRVGLQVCDDATADSGPLFDPRRCAANARRYANDPSVTGVVGPLVSGCATVEIPILNRARGGSIAIVSPSATVVGLTRPDRAGSVQPADLYPTGRRNFARVVPADDIEAAANALLAQQLGLKRVYALDDGEPFGESFVDNFVRAAGRLGLSVAGRGSWDAGQRSNGALAGAIARTHPDGVFLGVSSYPESIRLLRDLRARLGPAVQFMAPDPFDPATAALAGVSAEGMTISQSGPPNDQLAGEGKQFVASFASQFDAQPSRFAVAAAQAIDVLLDAIAHSDGTRASVTNNLYATTVSNGIFGSFSITPTGDTTLNAVAIYRIIGGKLTTFTTVHVPDALVGPD
jgi:branched-chain amino acid transport system substrate-binding protein